MMLLPLSALQESQRTGSWHFEAVIVIAPNGTAWQVWRML
jgi:hypothetical protein